MSIGDKKDWREFNCSQEHEFDYVKNLYSEPDKVYDWLKAACAKGKLNHSKHVEVYVMLKIAGFKKIS